MSYLYVFSPEGMGSVHMLSSKIGMAFPRLCRILHHIQIHRRGTQNEDSPYGRADDTMNLGGIKVSSAEIEQTLNSVSGIREIAAIAVSPEEGGPSRLVIYVVLLPETHLEKEALLTTLQAALKGHLNPLFKIHDVVIVDSLPRTRLHRRHD